MSRIVQVFNRYLQPGGEEASVQRIYRHVSLRHEVERCWYESRDWKGQDAPGPVAQLRKMFYHTGARQRFEEVLRSSRAEAALVHNVYPVASPSIYHAAHRQRLPVIQYLHNFRPFSVGGTLYARGKILPQALRGDYWPEVRAGAWQNSFVKSALFAVLLKALHASRWLESITAWVAISEFVRQRVIQAGLPPQRVHTLLHSWDARPVAPEAKDAGYYLFLGRLVEEKGIHTLLAAWEELSTQGGVAPALHIAGDGPLRGLVEERAKQVKGLLYRGQLDAEEKAAALEGCRAVIIPSTWWEPLGLVTYEAYDCAKPVLAARAGGLSETVQQGVTGWLHEPGKASQLVAQVLECESASPAQRHSMGAEGRAWLLAHTGVQQWQERFDQILTHALAQ